MGVTRFDWRFTMAWPVATLFWLIATGVSLYVVVFPLSMFAEDTYFYLQIAANVVAGLGVTFHGYMPTNGFHPLWMLCIVGLQALGQDRLLLPHLVMGAVVALALLGFWLVVAAARRLGFSYVYAGLAILLPYCLFTQIGSESALVLPAVLAAVLFFTRFAADGRAVDFALLQLALALAILSRLDTVFVAGSIGVASLAFAFRRHGLPRTLHLSLLPGALHILLLGGYLLWNWQTMGHLLPISGALKGAGEESQIFSVAKIADIGKAAMLLILVSGTLLLARGTARQRLVLLPLYAGIVMHGFYIAYAMSGLTIWSWYYGAWIAAAGLAMAHLATSAATIAARPLGEARAARLANWGCGLLVLALPSLWLAAKMPPVVAARDAGWARDTVAVFERNLPKNQAVFVTDYPGALAYLGGYRVLPADGLVNDYAYQDEVRRVGILAYLQARRIFYIMAPGPDLDAAFQQRFCGVLVHNATRVTCRPTSDGNAETVSVTVYAALNGQQIGVIPLARDHLAFTVPALGFGVWRIDPPPPDAAP